MAEMNFKQIWIMKLFQMRKNFYMLLNKTNQNDVPKENKIGIISVGEIKELQRGKYAAGT